MGEFSNGREQSVHNRIQLYSGHHCICHPTMVNSIVMEHIIINIFTTIGSQRQVWLVTLRLSRSRTLCSNGAGPNSMAGINKECS